MSKAPTSAILTRYKNLLRNSKRRFYGTVRFIRLGQINRLALLGRLGFSFVETFDMFSGEKNLLKLFTAWNRRRTRQQAENL